MVSLIICACQCPFGCRDYGVRPQVGQATKVSWFAVALVAGAARQLADVDRLGDAGGITPWCRATRQRGPIDAHDRYARRRGHVQGPAVAADEEGGACDQSPQLGEVELVAVDHRLGPRAELCPDGVPDAGGRGDIRRSRHYHEAPGLVRCGQRRGQIHEALLRPTAKPIARTHVEYDDLMFVADAGPRQGRRLIRATAAGSSAISTGSSYGSGGLAKGSPSAVSKSH